MPLLRGILLAFVEGAMAYGAALHGYPSLDYPLARWAFDTELEPNVLAV
jgi:hypothetical protein